MFSPGDLVVCIEDYWHSWQGRFERPLTVGNIYTIEKMTFYDGYSRCHLGTIGPTDTVVLKEIQNIDHYTNEDIGFHPSRFVLYEQPKIDEPNDEDII